MAAAKKGQADIEAEEEGVEVSLEEISFPTTKASLLRWLNSRFDRDNG